MSTLKVTNIQSNGTGFNDVVNFQNASGTQNGTLCRAWVNFNGTGTVAIRASFNVSSITDNGTGFYTVNFTNAMSDANYCTNATGTHDGGTYVSWGTVSNDTPPTASAVRTDFLNDNAVPTDVSFAQVSIFR